MNLLDSSRGRKILFASLYLSEGAPIGYIWWALPTQMRTAGVGVGEITSLTSLLILPWILKAFWAPVVDAVQGRRWTLREWIFTTQILMGAFLLPAALLDFSSNFPLIRAFLLLHAVAASLQDAAIDSLAISTVSPGQRGSLNGWMQTGYLAGRSVFGGLLLVLAARWGGNLLVLFLIMTIWGIAVMLLVFTDVPGSARPREAVGRRFRVYSKHFGSMVRRPSSWLGLLFALLGGAAFEGVGAVGGPYLIDRGLSQADVGWFFSVPAVAGTICGSLAGGYLSDRSGTLRTVGASLLAIVATVAGLAGLDALGARTGAIWTVTMFTLLYISIGFFTASSYAMFMNLTDPLIGATQFSAYMGATNGCESWSGYVTGRIVDGPGYGAAFLLLAAVSLASLPLLSRIHRAGINDSAGRGINPSGGLSSPGNRS